ncbi:L-fuconate dehydratase [Acidothermaceae bacterium B102]|nr:L-fuconate dehydratase [Acidothermaceae bacterium B102]
MPRVTATDVRDVRFPTSRTMDGSDAMHGDGDYSAAYVILRTDDSGLEGHGLTFTIGRGNELCVAVATMMAARLIGTEIDELASGGWARAYRTVTGDSQLRWVGPEKGVVHLAAAAVLNALWDAAAKRAHKPLWRLLVDMDPAQLVDACDFRYLSDAITRDEAMEILTSGRDSLGERLARLETGGYPAYTTSPGWLGYSDAKLRDLCRQAIADGWDHIKLKVGASRDDDVRRCAIAREELGPDRTLMIDANQVWDVPTAIDWVGELAQFDPLWIEEPTSPDDVLGHAAIRAAVAPVRVATGEHVQNRVVFKQLFQAQAFDFCQIDSCRLASVNEIVPVLLMAAKFGVPVCPHAGGVGLCEYVQHLSVFDYLCVSKSLDGRIVEYVDHLHEHFLDPVRVAKAAYVVPHLAGYSAQMQPESLATFTFPDGAFWAADAATEEADRVPH